MPRKTIYLDGPGRTQDLLDLKWALRSAGYAIGSSWHDIKGSMSFLGSADHWNAKRVEQLQACDWLVVVSGKSDNVVPEVSMMAGFALARGLEVVWIGPPVGGLTDFRAVRQYDSAEDFRRQLLLQMSERPVLTDDRLVA
jgi:hypothetical protein